MGAAEQTLEDYRFYDLSPAGFYVAARVGFAFPEFEHNAMPLAWVAKYAQGSFVLYDPVTRWLYENAGAVRWSEICDEDPRQVMSAAAEHGMTFGAAVCVRDFRDPSLRTFGAFARSDREFRDDEIAMLSEDLEALHLAQSPPDDLTEAELEVLVMTKRGLRIKEMAYQLGITDSAIKQRLRSGKAKLGSRTTAQAVTAATRYGLI